MREFDFRCNWNMRGMRVEVFNIFHVKLTQWKCAARKISENSGSQKISCKNFYFLSTRLGNHIFCVLKMFRKFNEKSQPSPLVAVEVSNEMQEERRLLPSTFSSRGQECQSGIVRLVEVSQCPGDINDLQRDSSDL